VAHDGLVDLATEIKHIRDYVVIETARFQDKLQVIYHVPDECNCLLPPLLLQPIVENAIKHGLYPKREGGTVTIAAQLWKDKIVITIEDNGVGMAPEQISEVLKPDPARNNIGLSNVYSRLKSIYGDECGFLIESETAKGTKVTITLPVEGETKDDKDSHC
jgi:two-component system sensor histidine kinase LytS